MLNKISILSKSGNQFNSIHILQVGAGGNGGYLVQQISKMIYAIRSKGDSLDITYTLVDGDRFEAKNLLRQPCIEEDIGLNKARVLAERYSEVYDIDISYVDRFVESVDDLSVVFAKSSSEVLKIIIGCVDNNASRAILNDLHLSLSNSIYIDSGVDEVVPDEEMTGYSGMTICGVRLDGRTLSNAIGEEFDNIYDKSDLLPTESCGDVIVSNPQRMVANMYASLITYTYVNNILHQGIVYSASTSFNSLYGVSRPEYLDQTNSQHALPEKVPES